MGGAGGNGNINNFFMPPCHCDELPSSSGGTTETNGQTYEAVGGVFSGMSETITSNAGLGTLVGTLRKGGVNQNATITFTTLQTGTQTWTGANDNVTAADSWSWGTTTTNGSGAIHGGSGLKFQANGIGATVMGNVGTGQSITTGTTTYWSPLGGDSTQNTTASLSQIAVQTAGTITNFNVVLFSNTRTDSQTITVGKGTTPQASTVTFTTTQTGRQIDSSHTSTFAAGDLLVFIVTGGGGSGAATAIGGQFLWTSTVDGKYWGGGCRANATAISATSYLSACGDVRPNATQAVPQVETNCLIAFSRLWTNVSVNSSTSTTTMNFEIGNSAASQTVAYTSTQTGTQQDTTATHIDTVKPTDLSDISMSGMNANITLISRTLAMSVIPNKFNFHNFA